MELETTSRYRTAEWGTVALSPRGAEMIPQQYRDPSTSALSPVSPIRQRPTIRSAAGLPPRGHTEGSTTDRGKLRLKYALIVVSAIAIVLFVIVVVLLWPLWLSGFVRHY